MRIGELSKRTGLTVETLRFYERAGLLGSVSRDRSGYRVYDEQAYRTLVTVRWAQGVGLRLEDIALILAPAATMAPTDRVVALERVVADRLSALRSEIEQLESAIARLELLRAIPFAGECIIPASFVDALVREHEREPTTPSPSANGKRGRRRGRG